MTKQELQSYYWLKQYKRIDDNVNKLLEESEMWRSRAEKITSTISDMPRAGDREDQRESAICKMVDCEQEADKLIDQLCDLRNQIKQYILITGDNDEELNNILNPKNKHHI